MLKWVCLNWILIQSYLQIINDSSDHSNRIPGYNSTASWDLNNHDVTIWNRSWASTFFFNIFIWTFSFYYFLRFSFFLFWCGPSSKSSLNLSQPCLRSMPWHSCRKAYGILVPRPGIESATPCIGWWSPNHWTTLHWMAKSLDFSILKTILCAHEKGSKTRSVALE